MCTAYKTSKKNFRSTVDHFIVGFPQVYLAMAASAWDQGFTGGK